MENGTLEEWGPDQAADPADTLQQALSVFQEQPLPLDVDTKTLNLSTGALPVLGSPLRTRRTSLPWKRSYFQKLLLRSVALTTQLPSSNEADEEVGEKEVMLRMLEAEMRMEEHEEILEAEQQRMALYIEQQRQLLKMKLEAADRQLEQEEAEIREQERILEITMKEREEHPELELDYLASQMNATPEDDEWTRKMREDGGLELRKKNESKLIAYTALPPPLSVNAFFRSPSPPNLQLMDPPSSSSSNKSTAATSETEP
eukprot:comp5807_c0_seq1/m.1662 comp5807_c0_seq1/g.1662  ORF comp5807_c0_seq1/g.1662 comp5807_c0_seq1/m.1662 type:complete len:259 (-) comp5807_c0_seq1:137-913(-)